MQLEEIFSQIKGSVRENVDLSRTNWFGVGGKAKYLFRPADIDDLCFFLKNKPQDINVITLGVGSNLLVRDNGIDAVIIKLGKGFTNIKITDNMVQAGAGALDYNVAMLSCSKNIGGLEFLSGIPGTIGGALAMNAGCYGKDISSILKSAILVDEQGYIHKLSKDDIGYVYRGNTLPDNMIFVEAIFEGYYDEKENIQEKIDKITKERTASQPIKSKTSGSTFKNPINAKAWELIDKVGLRGKKIGGAQISEKHCNFFINTGNATASDIENLGELVIDKVYKETGIKLNWEIQIIGNK